MLKLRDPIRGPACTEPCEYIQFACTYSFIAFDVHLTALLPMSPLPTLKYGRAMMRAEIQALGLPPGT